MSGIEFVGELLFRLAMMAAWIASVIWVYRDAKRIGKSASLVAILVFVTWPIGLVVWLFLRPRWMPPVAPVESTQN
jgi:hypothetical protein